MTPAIEPNSTEQTVTVLSYAAGMAQSFVATLDSADITLLSAEAHHAGQIHCGATVILLTSVDGTMRRAEVRVESVDKAGPAYRIRCEHYSWEDLDRRRYRRLPRMCDFSYRIIHEDRPLDWVLGAKTLDLSLDGARVQLNEPLEIGMMVELRIELGSSMPVRVVGLVARVMAEPEESFGIEFVDYMAGARYYLHSALHRAA